MQQYTVLSKTYYCFPLETELNKYKTRRASNDIALFSRGAVSCSKEKNF